MKKSSKIASIIVFGIGYMILCLMIAAAYSAMECDPNLPFGDAMTGAIARIFSMGSQAFFPISSRLSNHIAVFSLAYVLFCLWDISANSKEDSPNNP